MKKIKKIMISAIALILNMYSCCFATIELKPTIPPSEWEPVPPNYFLVNLIIGLILLLGIIFLSIGLGIKHNRKKKLSNCSETTKGKIIDIVKRTYNGTGDDWTASYTFHPVIEYNVNNQKYVKTSNFGTNPSKYEAGQKVEIHYNPDNCDTYYIGGENTQKKLGTIFTTIGIIILFVAVVVAIIVTNIIA